MLLEWIGTLLAIFGGYLLFSTPEATRDEFGNIMDPVGGNRLKNLIGFLMAKIAKMRETAAFNKETLEELERFHPNEKNEFWNESYYYNGCELGTGDRIITRISRRGVNADKTYVFLLLDLKEHGQLSLEKDNVPAELKEINPSVLGLKFEMIEPMKKWRVTYKGRLRKGCPPPEQIKQLEEEEEEEQEGNQDTKNFVDVEFDLLYEKETPIFYYMRDDCTETLGKNLSQEPWNLKFLKVCLARNANHGHYEHYGRLKGNVTVNGKMQTCDFGTFADHSHDLRSWSAMDHLFILLLAFDKPLRLFGHEYHYMDVTLVSMPDNSAGVERYSTGYLMGKEDSGAPILSMVCGTSINDIPFARPADGSPRLPMNETDIICYVRPEPCHELSGSVAPSIGVRVKMSGDIRRLIYYPDDGAFIVYEDYLDFSVTQVKSGQTVKGYGTRQSGFRVGKYDPSRGGCG